jgi:hypothetical protein
MSLLGIGSILLLAACSREQAPSITLGSGGIGGNYEVAGRAIARTVNQDHESHGFELEVEISEGSAANIDAILAGDIAFGLAQADQQHQASNGLARWADKGPQTQLRAVFSLYSEVVTLVAGADSGITTMQDLRGKRVDIGPPGSGTRQNAIDALSAAGIDWNTDVRVAEEADLTDERLAKFMHGEIAAFFYTVGHPNQDVRFATYSARGARFIPLINTDELLAAFPYYSSSIIPEDQYPRANNAQDVETIGVRSVLLTSADVPDEVVYSVTKAVFENIEALREFHAVLGDLSREDMLQGFTVPFHPGALRYFREAGLSVPKG